MNFISVEKCNFGVIIKVRGNLGGSKWKIWGKEMICFYICLFDVNSLFLLEMSYSENKI